MAALGSPDFPRCTLCKEVFPPTPYGYFHQAGEEGEAPLTHFFHETCFDSLRKKSSGCPSCPSRPKLEKKFIPPTLFTQEQWQIAEKTDQKGKFLLGLCLSHCAQTLVTDMIATLSWIPLNFVPHLQEPLIKLNPQTLPKILQGIERKKEEKEFIAKWMQLTFKKKLSRWTDKQIFESTEFDRNPFQQFLRGICYMNGNAGTINNAAAQQCFLVASKEVPAAQFFYASLEIRPAFQKERMNGIQESLNQGIATAIRTSGILGLKSARASGFECEKRAALATLKQGAGLDDPGILSAIGDCYANGFGVERDPFEAYYYQMQAAEFGEDPNPEPLKKAANALLQLGEAIAERAETNKDMSNPRSFFESAMLYEATGNRNDAILCYQQASDLGYQFANISIARINK